MRIRHSARAAVALAAAYAVALQTILLVFGGPVTGAAHFAAQPICSYFGDSGPAPAGPGHDCLEACLTGCCCGAVAVPLPGVAGIAAPMRVQRVGAAVAVAAPTVRLTATGAHRSRAPPPA
jgi:hypothetical protein